MTRHLDRQQHTPAPDSDVDRRLLAATRRVRIAAVPPELSEALRAAFVAREPLATRVRRHFAAVMQFDGLAGPALVGIRGGLGGARQLVYACEVADVTFHATSEGEGVWRLDGIVLSLDDDDDVQYDVRLDMSGGDRAAGLEGLRGATARSTLTDPAGEFHFAAVGPGDYWMTVTGPEFAVEVGPFELVDAPE